TSPTNIYTLSLHDALPIYVLHTLSDKNLEKFRSEQELPKAIITGIVVGLIGALLWGAITVITEFQIGFMAIAIGAGVGLSMRFRSEEHTSELQSRENLVCR